MSVDAWKLLFYKQEILFAEKPLKVGFVSLGCPKNLVDSEVMMGELVARGHELTPYPDQADVAVAYEKELTGVAAPKVASMTLSVSSGIEWSQLIKERVTKAGGSLVGAFPIPPTSTNADVVVQKIAALHPTWITVHGGPNISEILLKSMEKFGVQIPVVGIFATGGHRNQNVINTANGHLAPRIAITS